MSLLYHDVTREPFGLLSAFRAELYASLTARADALFELTDAMLCANGPVKTLAGLALAAEHRRGHRALYSGLNRGRLEVGRLRRAVAAVPLPKAADGRLVLAADVTPWLRPDADTAPDRCCHTYGYGDNKHLLIPGRPYSAIAALETRRTSWTAVLDAVRLEPGADVATVTTAQIREIVERLITAGQWREGGPDVLVVVDAGCDAPRLAHLLAGTTSGRAPGPSSAPATWTPAAAARYGWLSHALPDTLRRYVQVRGHAVTPMRAGC